MALEAELLVASLKSIRNNSIMLRRLLRGWPKASRNMLSEEHPGSAVRLRHDIGGDRNPHRFENRPS